MHRLVVDTNVIVSAAIVAGKSRKFLLKAPLGGKCTLVTSDEIVGEIREVLSRPKFRLDESEISGAVSTLKSLSNVVETKSKFRVVKKDPDDDMFINTAYDGRADYIVVGDPHMLDLKKWRGVRIVTVTKMLEILQSDG